MKSILAIVLAVILVPNQFKTRAQELEPTRPTSTAIIRIQSCVDNSFITIFPKNPPATAGPEPEPSTSTASTTPTSDGTAGPPVVEVEPVVGDEDLLGNSIVYWKVNWANAMNSTLGTKIIAADHTTSLERCLGPVSSEDNRIGVWNNNCAFIWNFVPYFDSITWTYHYEILSNGKNLQHNPAGFILVEKNNSANNGLDFQFNLLS